MEKDWIKKEQEYHAQAHTELNKKIKELKGLVVNEGFILDEKHLEKDYKPVADLIVEYLRNNPVRAFLLGYIISFESQSTDLSLLHDDFFTALQKVITMYFHCQLYHAPIKH